MTPAKAFKTLTEKCKTEWKAAFLAAVIIGLLVHMPVMLSDIPNHDGLDSIYFDQNMITSGRWFLMIACGFSSFYSLPWVIGLIGLLFLGAAAAALTEILQVKQTWAAVLIGGLLAVFPSLASTFAYVFTLDGYMLALLLAVLAVLFTQKYKWGFVPGAICLAFSMGTYQAYLPMTMILCVFAILMLLQTEGTAKEKCMKTLQYPLMGVCGMALYYIILQILLAVQGKSLASYQGIDSLNGVGTSSEGFTTKIYQMYRNFFAFLFKGNVLFNNGISLALLLVLAGSAAVALIYVGVRRNWWKKWQTYIIIVVAAGLTPAITNVILFISADATYHLLMKYQWVLFPIGMIAFISKLDERKMAVILQWCGMLACAGLVFFYGVTDNIGYSNLQKKYEKTYSYCVRLLDRIEQTEGYYQGIPIAMIGVVGEDPYPVTDVTEDVTAGMIGLGGDYLLYTGQNYQKFMKHYLGATLNMLPAEAMAEMYYDERYKALDSFPGENSIAIIDGIMYIKTENLDR